MMPSLEEGERAILRMAEQAIRDVWPVVVGEPAGEGVIRMEGVEEPETFKGPFYTRSSTLCPDDERCQDRKGLGLIEDSTARRYRYKGNLHIKVLGAKWAPNPYRKIKDICRAIENEFIERRDAETGIEFKRVSRNDHAPKDGQWYQVYMTAEWQFDVIRRVKTG